MATWLVTLQVEVNRYDYDVAQQTETYVTEADNPFGACARAGACFEEANYTGSSLILDASVVQVED